MAGSEVMNGLLGGSDEGPDTLHRVGDTLLLSCFLNEHLRPAAHQQPCRSWLRPGLRRTHSTCPRHPASERSWSPHTHSSRLSPTDPRKRLSVGSGSFQGEAEARTTLRLEALLTATHLRVPFHLGIISFKKFALFF